MSRRASDAWLGATVLLACFALLCYLTEPLIATRMLAALALLGLAGHVVLHLWLQPQHGLQRLACALLTLPVLGCYGIVCAIAVFQTMWRTHAGHDFPLPGKGLPPGADSGA